MSELLMAEAIVADMEADYVARRYEREWRQLRTIDRLKERLRLRQNRLGLLDPSFVGRQPRTSYR